MDVFRVDLMVFELCISVFMDLDMMVFYYNFILLLLFDKYVFLRIKFVVNRKCVFWFDYKIKDVIKVRWRVERKWCYFKFV